jgi:acetylserotonin N-methyltransferase
MSMSTQLLEVPAGDSRVIWDIYLSATILPSVAACDEVGVFTLLEATPLNRAELATRLNLTEEWAEVLLGVLGAVDLVRVQDGRFHLTDSARSFFLPDSPFYAGFTLRRFAQNDVGARLKRAMSSAETNSDRYVVRKWEPGDLTPEQVSISTRTMHGLSFAAAVAMARTGDFTGVTRLLDVAGGSGGFAIALAQQHPEMRCSVADLPIVCDLTREYIAQYGVADRVDAVPLNMFFEPWPTGYDAMFFSCVLHDWALPQRTELIQRAFDALPAGGSIYIHEMLLNDAGDGPTGPALFSINMRIGTAGKQFTAPEMRGALEDAGFRNVRVQNTYGYFSLMRGVKP